MGKPHEVEKLTLPKRIEEKFDQHMNSIILKHEDYGLSDKGAREILTDMYGKGLSEVERRQSGERRQKSKTGMPFSDRRKADSVEKLVKAIMDQHKPYEGYKSVNNQKFVQSAKIVFALGFHHLGDRRAGIR